MDNPRRGGGPLSISRDDLVRRLAEISHLTYVRQKNRDHGVPLAQLSLEVTDHDRERAEDTVAELERLGVYREAVPGPAPEDREPPEPLEPEPDVDAPPRKEPKPVTDLWGNPIARRRRGR